MVIAIGKGQRTFADGEFGDRNFGFFLRGNSARGEP